MRRLAFVAIAVPVLALASACAPKPADTDAGKTPATPTDGVTADRLADYQKVAACMKEQGVTVPEPKAGQPFDDSEMNRLFSEDKTKWNNVLANCDYKRVVIGVG